jgi:hypothetical protein
MDNAVHKHNIQCENHTKFISMLYGQNGEFITATTGSIYTVATTQL